MCLVGVGVPVNRMLEFVSEDLVVNLGSGTDVTYVNVDGFNLVADGPNFPGIFVGGTVVTPNQCQEAFRMWRCGSPSTPGVHSVPKTFEING